MARPPDPSYGRAGGTMDIVPENNSMELILLYFLQFVQCMIRRKTFYEERDRTTDCGRDARNNTAQTQSRTISLKMNSPVRFQAIGSVDKLHLTTPGVVKKNDHVMAKVTIPISEPTADRIRLNPPAPRSAAIVNSATPRK